MSKYFVFEGIDGVGKTTTMRNVAIALNKLGADFVLTKEPGGPKALYEEWDRPNVLYNKLGFQYPGFRPLCVDNPQIPPLTKRALYRADAFYNWESVIQPSLEKGKLVLSDRNWVSDLAYGTVLTKCDMEQLLDFNLALVPEMQALTNVIYLELPKEVREYRLSKNMADAMDTLGEEVRDKIASAYEEVLRDWVPSGQVHRVSTLESEELVTQKIVDLILSQ